MRKFRNIPVEVDGARYDSKKEAKRAGELALLARIGEINSLERQVRFPMVVNGEPVCTYVADFTYRRDGVLVVEDVKSPPTRRQATYRIKAKLLKALHGLNVAEV